MKICHITTIHKSHDIRIFYKQCVSLAQDGHSVTLIAKHKKTEYKSGVLIKRISSHRSLLNRIVFNHIGILLYCLKSNYHLYHAHDPELIPLLSILRLFGKKVVYDMHENFSLQLREKKISPSNKRLISFFWMVLEKHCIPQLNIIYAEISYQKYYSVKKNSAVVLNFPKVKNIKKCINKKHSLFTLGYVGGVSKNRCCLQILNALEMLQTQGMEVGFKCVGQIRDNSLKKIINSKLKNLKNVKFYGHLPPEQSWEIISQCHIGLALLKPIGNYVESYPTKMFEYIAMNMPVICSNFNLYKQVIQKNKLGLCIDPLSEIEICNAVTQLYFKNDSFNETQKNILKFNNDSYTWDHEMKKIYELYEKIVSKSKLVK